MISPKENYPLETSYNPHLDKDKIFFQTNSHNLTFTTKILCIITLRETSFSLPFHHTSAQWLSIKVFSFPVPVNSSSNHATQLLDTPEYFITREDNQHYATMTSNQLSDCSGTTTLFCTFSIALTASASPNCHSSIFFNQKKKDTAKLCDFRFLLNSLKPSISEISPSHVLLYQTTTIALDCSLSHKILKGCTFCVMKIPCRCSISTRNLYLPPRLGKCNNNTDKISILHPINLALL